MKELRKLLFYFCSDLFCSSIKKLDSINEYYEIIYQDQESTFIYNTDYDEDVDYLINYHQKHGCYPAKFQQLFNEWLLMRM